MAADKTSWNYFTLESICKAKCALCGTNIRPTIYKQRSLNEHLRTKHQADHASIKNLRFEDINWDEFYHTIKSMTVENMLNPKVKCTSCPYVMYIQVGADINRKLIHASPDMKAHLKDEHQIDERTRIQMKSLSEWIEDNAGNYCNITKSAGIKLYTCTLCDNDDNEIRTNTAIMFLKHLSDKHRHNIQNFPWAELPEQFLLSTPRNEDVDINLQDSPLALSLPDFSDISTDRSRQIGSISEIERSNTSNQPPSDTRDILNISQGIQQQANIIMANVLDEGLQPDMHVPSNIQLPSDPKDIPSTSSGKRKSDTQIEESSYKRKKSNVELIKKYNEDIFKIIYTSNKEIFKLMHEREATIFKLMHEREATIFKLMHEREETIFNKIEEIKKILEEMSKDDS